MIKLSTLKYEFKRLWLLLFISMIVFIPDLRGFYAVLFSLGIVTFIMMVIHLWRKMAFPYLNMEELVSKSKESSIGSAIVLASMMYLLATLVSAMSLMISR